ncbi:MAG: alpha/beta hydrolase [Chloroflexota bacterium]|nr:alpha/beta hydrolase [Chloroflexota bacterium]
MSEQPRSRVGTADINGTRFVYEVAGHGHPLVLVHAGIADRRMWDDQWSVFAEHYQVIRYDMRGFGDTPMVAGPFAHRHDLFELLRFLGIGQAYLLGCSQGGTTIIDFALEHPEMAAALIPVCSTPSGQQFTGEPPRQLNEVIAAFDAGDLERASELEVQIWVDGRKRSPYQVPAAIRDRVRAMNLIALRSDAANLGGISQPLEPPAVGRLGELQAPTLVIVGALDEPGVIEAGETMARTIPEVRKIVIAGTAHMPNMERPDEFNRVVLEFLREVEESNTHL